MSLYLKDTKKYKIKARITLLLFSLGIETFQLFISRGVDINDVILNFFGGIIGCNVFAFVQVWFHDTINPIRIKSNGKNTMLRLVIFLDWGVYAGAYYRCFFG